jgi:hypothetical protein
VPKFDERIQHGKSIKLQHQNLVMDGIHNIKNLEPSNGSKVSKKFSSNFLECFDGPNHFHKGIQTLILQVKKIPRTWFLKFHKEVGRNGEINLQW